MMIVFSILVHDDPMTGYSLLKKIEQASNGKVTFSAGAIYPQIDEYVEQGFMSRILKQKVSKSSGRTREIALFGITNKGKTLLEELRKKWQELVIVTGEMINPRSKDI